MTGPDAVTRWSPAVPVSLSLALGLLQRGPGDPTQQVGPDGALWRTARTPAGPATLRLTIASNGEVEAQSWGPGAEWMIDGVPGFLGAHDDVSEFSPAHPVVAASWRRFPHLRTSRLGLLFEVLVPAVLEQRVTGKEARRSWRHLVRRYGEPAPGPVPVDLRVCPPPEVWHRVPSWEWHRANVDPGRARTVVGVATVAARLEESLLLPREERLRRLRSVPGVGRWTAAEVAQRAWGDPDEVSYGDFHIAALIGWALVGRPIDDDEMMDVLAVYPGHRQRAVRLVELSGARKPAFGPRMPVGDIRAL